MSAKIDQLVARIQELQAQTKAEGKVLFEAAFKDFFTAHPCVEKITWEQYTPYFNDGDTCRFSVHDPRMLLDLGKLDDTTKKYLEMNEDYDVCHSNLLEILSEQDKESRWYKFPEGLRTEMTDDERAAVSAYSALTKSLFRNELKDLFEDLFGDHVTVTVTANGAETDHYEHD